MDDFFESYYRHRPVNATFIGVHDHDHRLPDLSEAGVSDVRAQMRDLLARLPALQDEPPSRSEEMDRRLASGFLRIQLWELDSRHFQAGNPCLYTGEAVFGFLSLFLHPVLPLKERVDAAVARMRAIETLLGQGRANVRKAPPSWKARAVRECDGALALFGRGVDLLTEEEGIDAPSFREAADSAASAFVRHRARLLALDAADEDYSCGEDALRLYLARGHCLDEDPASIARRAEAELADAEARLREASRQLGAKTPEAALGRLADSHPTAAGYYAAYTREWESIRAQAIEAGLLSWPDFPIRYVPRPRWVREAAPFLYFLYYRSPAALQRPAVHDYLVTPIEPDLERAERDRLLQANNLSEIRLNHVIHHGGIGHHVQNWNAFRAESRIGRVAAVDCASRIAMFCGGTMAEGWACYATDLMSEFGALSPLEQCAEHHARGRMCARAVVDIKLHTGEWTLAQCADYYRHKAAMSPAAAEGEAVKNSMFPGAALMYMVGTNAIHELRNDLEACMGADFDLRSFHDRFLSYGSVPVALVAAAMKAEMASTVNEV